MRCPIPLAITSVFVLHCSTTTTTAIPQERRTRSGPPHLSSSSHNDNPQFALPINQGNNNIPPPPPPPPLSTQQQQPQKQIPHHPTNNNNNNHQIPSTPPSLLLKKSTLPLLFAFLAGVSDIACHRRYDCYAGMMTGNVISIATALAELRMRDASRLFFVLFAYFGGVASHRSVHLHSKRKENMRKSSSSGSSSSATQESCSKIIVPVTILFALEEYLYQRSSGNGGTTTPRFFLGGPIFLGYAHGLINGAAANATGGIVAFAITGHLNKLGNALVDYFQYIFKSRKEKKRWRKDNKAIRKAYKMSFQILNMFGLGIFVATLLGKDEVLGRGMPSHWILKSPFVLLALAYAVLLSLVGRSMDDVVRFFVALY